MDESKWIPVTERLPEWGEEVLSYSENGSMEVNHITDEDDEEWFYDGVIAWMPLPEAYKPEKRSYNMKGEYIPSAKAGACFHGETWLRCPHDCGFSFEVFDAEFERKGIMKMDKRTYKCPKCGKKFIVI